MRLDRRPATPHPGYNIGWQEMGLTVQGEGDKTAHYSITLNALCAEGEWDKENGVCPAE